MELTTAFFPRLVAVLTALSAAHWMTRPRNATTPVPEMLPALETARLLVAGIAAATVPVFNPEIFALGSNGTLAGLWTLLLLAIVLPLSSPQQLEKYTQSAHWLCAWGLSLAVPITLFGQTELDRVGSVQDGLLGDLLPVWGCFFQPAAFLVAVVALAAWMASQTDRSVSPRRSSGLINGVLVATTVVVFLGAWHLPWVSDTSVGQWVGERRLSWAFLEFGIFTLKLAALGWAVRRLAESGRWKHPRLTGIRLTFLAAGNLLLTWALLCWRGV